MTDGYNPWRAKNRNKSSQSACEGLHYFCFGLLNTRETQKAKEFDSSLIELQVAELTSEVEMQSTSPLPPEILP